MIELIVLLFVIIVVILSRASQIQADPLDSSVDHQHDDARVSIPPLVLTAPPTTALAPLDNRAIPSSHVAATQSSDVALNNESLDSTTTPIEIHPETNVQKISPESRSENAFAPLPRKSHRRVSFSPRIDVRTYNINNGDIVDQYRRNT